MRRYAQAFEVMKEEVRKLESIHYVTVRDIIGDVSLSASMGLAAAQGSRESDVDAFLSAQNSLFVGQSGVRLTDRGRKPRQYEHVLTVLLCAKYRLAQSIRPTFRRTQSKIGVRAAAGSPRKPSRQRKRATLATSTLTACSVVSDRTTCQRCGNCSECRNGALLRRGPGPTGRRS